jgi:RNA polymerase sigma-70 factor (ECF subfamily)
MKRDSAGGRFPTTRWTLIRRLKSPDASTVRRALNDLCAQYYYPLYCYIRHRGFDHHDAEDALHDFLAKLLRLEAFEDAAPDRGRLRAFLGTALRRFLSNWCRDRPHRAREVSLDLPAPAGDAEERYRRERFTDADTPERIFDRQWGLELLHRVVHRLGESYAARGRTPIFETLRPVLLAGGSLRGGDTSRYATALATTEGAVRVALSRLLRDYRDLLEDEVLQTVESTAEVDTEIGHLLQVFRTE